MTFIRSIRWRLLLWYGLILAVMLGGFGYTAWRVGHASRFQQIDQEIQRRLSVLTSALRWVRPPGRSSPPEMNLNLTPSEAALFDSATGSSFYYAVWLRGEEPVAKSANAPENLPHPVDGEPSPRQRGTAREAFLFTPPVDCVLVGRVIDDDLAAQQQFSWLLAGAGGCLLACGLAGGWWLVSQALRPVRDISSTAARIAGGDLSQRINTAHTESELGELAAVLNSTFERLDDAFILQARFTSDAAHELRTPVSVLLTQTQGALQRERQAQEYRTTLLANEAVAQRMRRLIDSLLELSRFDAGHGDLEQQSSDLAVIAEDGIEVLQPLAELHRISIQRDLSQAICRVDPDRVGQVVTNLLTNAIEYNSEGGEVTISTRRQGAQVQLIVADKGPGIRAEDLPHIFERFYRADKARSGASSRTGLGLAISKAVVEAHGGTLEVFSEHGHGAAFTMSFPAAP